MNRASNGDIASVESLIGSHDDEWGRRDTSPLAWLAVLGDNAPLADQKLTALLGLHAPELEMGTTSRGRFRRRTQRQRILCGDRQAGRRRCASRFHFWPVILARSNNVQICKVHGGVSGQLIMSAADKIKNLISTHRPFPPGIPLGQILFHCRLLKTIPSGSRIDRPTVTYLVLSQSFADNRRSCDTHQNQGRNGMTVNWAACM